MKDTKNIVRYFFCEANKSVSYSSFKNYKEYGKLDFFITVSHLIVKKAYYMDNKK